jgi:hypothetical protein
MHVDETGTHDAAPGIDRYPGLSLAQLADSHHPAPGYADVSPAHRRPGAINDLPALNEEIHSVHLEREFWL